MQSDDGNGQKWAVPINSAPQWVGLKKAYTAWVQAAFAATFTLQDVREDLEGSTVQISFEALAPKKPRGVMGSPLLKRFRESPVASPPPPLDYFLDRRHWENETHISSLAAFLRNPASKIKNPKGAQMRGPWDPRMERALGLSWGIVYHLVTRDRNSEAAVVGWMRNLMPESVKKYAADQEACLGIILQFFHDTSAALAAAAAGAGAVAPRWQDWEFRVVDGKLLYKINSKGKSIDGELSLQGATVMQMDGTQLGKGQFCVQVRTKTGVLVLASQNAQAQSRMFAKIEKAIPALPQRAWAS